MELSEKQYTAVTLLALGKTCKEVAEQLGVTPKTVSVWRADPEFRAAVNRCRKDYREAQTRRLSSLCDKALTTIEESLNDEALKIEDKLKASFKILELCKVSPEEIGATDARRIRMQDLFESM
ncbi:helix-turn-helix domain-containing protein [Nitrosomonas sp. Nm33]|uniref:helix-turn-helix domain-containing protein n=1 Tax=Nitrosomonas sp. Nm33 TaxID=133724 RepID=UPI0008968918|nr:helix-turn-helix domain-containing protein [Nitrosomonas sp. Nm33]SDZ17896.1 regulatory protein, luxR family [Nitrosomonas sp. Nm33]